MTSWGLWCSWLKAVILSISTGHAIQYPLLIKSNGETPIPLIGKDFKTIATKLKDVFQGWPSTHVALKHSISVRCSRSTRLLLLGENEVVLISAMPKSLKNDVMTPSKKAAALFVTKFLNSTICEHFRKAFDSCVCHLIRHWKQPTVCRIWIHYRTNISITQTRIKIKSTIVQMKCMAEPWSHCQWFQKQSGHVHI